jgi:hypothetical protein
MKMAHQSHFAPRELALLHAAHHNDCGEEAPNIPEEQADGTSAIYRHHTIAVKRGPPKMALIGIKIADEYDIPMWMSPEIFLDRRDREKAARKFLGRFGNPWENRTVLQGQADETGGERRFHYILNGIPKRIDVDRRVQM